MTAKHKRKKRAANPHDLSTNLVRAHFVAKGSSLRQWSLDQGYNEQTVKMALYGKRNGDLSREIISKLKEEIGA